jgi:iron complex outermembrane receptor protein
VYRIMGFRDPMTLMAVEVTAFGSTGLKSEELLSYEIGYRAQLSERVSFDAAFFYSEHENLIGSVRGTPFLSMNPFPHLVVPQTLVNTDWGESFGGELAVYYYPIDGLKVTATYTYFWLATNSVSFKHRDPRNQAMIRASWDVSETFRIDASVFYVDSLPGFDVDRFVRGDLGVTWKPSSKIEITLMGQNLFDDRHAEYGESVQSIGVVPTEIERSGTISVTLRY